MEKHLFQAQDKHFEEFFRKEKHPFTGKFSNDPDEDLVFLKNFRLVVDLNMILSNMKWAIIRHLEGENRILCFDFTKMGTSKPPLLCKPYVIFHLKFKASSSYCTAMSSTI